MAHGKLSNIWEKNSIPPLPWCSLNRAATLLKCELSDFSAWMNHLNPMIEFKQSSVEGTLTVTLNNYDNPYEYGDISKEYIDLIPVASRGGLNPTSPMIDTAFIIDKNKKTLDFVGYFDGMASVLEGMYLIENDELMVLPQDLFCEIPIAKLGAPYVGEDRPVLSVDDILIRPVYAYCYDAQPIVLSMNDVYLSREDIELIYNCGVQGIDLPEDRLTVSESIKAKPKIRETAKQSRFIAYLINALGVKQDELKTLSIKNIMDRLSHMANEVKFPDVTDDSLRDWLEKAGYR